MKTVLNSQPGARRAGVGLLLLAAVIFTLVSARAYTPAQFGGIQSQLHADIAALGAVENPTRDERKLLKTLQRGSNVLTKISLADGKTLRSLNSMLGRRAEYQPVLTAIRSNLLAGFNAQESFVTNLLAELPESPAATTVRAQHLKFTKTSAKVNTAPTVASFAGRYDAAKRKLDDLLFRANEASLIPFPAGLSLNSVSASINGINFLTSLGAATDNSFTAILTETNVSVTLAALVNSAGGPRGILFSIPDAPLGAFRHAIPGPAAFTNRTGIYSPEETNTAATNGAIFINATATEVYGTFSCSGPGFSITNGKFRITISTP